MVSSAVEAPAKEIPECVLLDPVFAQCDAIQVLMDGRTISLTMHSVQATSACPGARQSFQVHFARNDIVRVGMFERPNVAHLIQQLHANPFFTDLDNEALLELAHESVWRTYAAGEVVFLEGEASPGLYYLHSGWLKAVKTSPEGREQVLRFIGPGETFNEIGAFARHPNPATAIALEAAGVWLLRREVLLRLLRHQPDLAQQVIENMASRVIDLVNLVADLSLRSVSGRLARLLLDEASGDVLHRPRWHTQAELAARLGTVPDVVQRALRGLESEGAIEVHRQEIHIRDRAALEKLAA